MEQSAKTNSTLYSRKFSLYQAPTFSKFKYIYDGPHISADGVVDDRVWFSIPIEVDVEKNTITYLIFPFGAADEEIIELPFEVPASWIA